MADFEEMFPELYVDEDKIRVVNEEDMKSAVGKNKWREFIAKYETKGRWRESNSSGRLQLWDTDSDQCSGRIHPEQHDLLYVVYAYPVTRFQFYVFEIARCRRGMNDWVREQALKAKEVRGATDLSRSNCRRQQARLEARRDKKRDGSTLLCTTHFCSL